MTDTETLVAYYTRRLAACLSESRLAASETSGPPLAGLATRDSRFGHAERSSVSVAGVESSVFPEDDLPPAVVAGAGAQDAVSAIIRPDPNTDARALPVEFGPEPLWSYPAAEPPPRPWLGLRWAFGFGLLCGVALVLAVGFWL